MKNPCEEDVVARALRDAANADAGPSLDVREALQRRLQAETHDGRVSYVVVQVVLLGALLAAGAWYFWR